MTPKQVYRKCLREKKRISELENIIVTDPEYSYRYACDIIKGTWELGEDIISKDQRWSYHYACDIIKGPWERGEEAISKHPRYSFLYARDIIEKPFEKCHYMIFNSEYKNYYIKFLKSINYDLNKILECEYLI